MSYIHPNYFGLSATLVLLFSDFESDCEKDGGSQLECYISSGDAVLRSFDFNRVNPYLNIMVSDLYVWI